MPHHGGFTGTAHGKVAYRYDRNIKTVALEHTPLISVFAKQHGQTVQGGKGAAQGIVKNFLHCFVKGSFFRYIGFFV